MPDFKKKKKKRREKKKRKIALVLGHLEVKLYVSITVILHSGLTIVVFTHIHTLTYSNKHPSADIHVHIEYTDTRAMAETSV